MAKKRKRVYKIMKLTPECDQKVKDGVADVNYQYDTHEWDAECTADYFFMTYNPSDVFPNMDIYYRDFTMLTVNRHYRKCRECIEVGKYRSYDVCDENYIISKYDTISNSYLEVYRTSNMDSVVSVFQLFNDYSSVAWYVDYQSFIDPFVSLISSD